MSGIRYDYEDQICEAQAFTGASTVSAHSREKQTAAQDISIGRRMALLVMPTVNAGAGSTHVMEVIQADNTALTTNPESLGSITVLAAQLIKGKEFEIPIPQGSVTRKHIGFRHTATGGTTTVTLDVYLVPQDENVKYKSFPKINHSAL